MLILVTGGAGSGKSAFAESLLDGWRGEKIYLSLGDREEFGGPPLLRTVGVCTRAAYTYYKEKGLDTLLEWNKGGHGKGVDARWEKALAWVVPRLGKE